MINWTRWRCRANHLQTQINHRRRGCTSAGDVPLPASQLTDIQQYVINENKLFSKFHTQIMQQVSTSATSRSLHVSSHRLHGGRFLRGADGAKPPPPSVSQRSNPKMKFLVSVNGHLGWKYSDYIWLLCQKLNICTTDKIFLVTDPPSDSPGPPKWEAWTVPAAWQPTN